MQKYTPNFNDPRVQRKVRSAVGWATSVLNEHTAQGWSSRYLDKKIGYLHTDLGRYLRENLLILASSYYRPDSIDTKKYRLNLLGVWRICKHLNINPKPNKIRKSVALSIVSQEYAPAFASGAFEYTEKSNRFWHDLQSVTTEIRKPLFAQNGYNFDYDIANCYPTLVLQLVKRTGRTRKPLTALEEYVLDPKATRTALAERIGCSTDTAKEVILAKFNGASLSPRGSIVKLLKPMQFHRLKADPWFCVLVKDLRRAWNAVARDKGLRSLNGNARMQIYLSQEHAVMSVIRREFSKKNIPIFLEHDGWRAKDYIDPYLLKLQVKNKTGYDVTFTCEVIRREI
jgi:hypothetical protein